MVSRDPPQCSQADMINRFFPSPNLVSNHLEDMRASHGNVMFASADWAVGWRSFIDGAIEEGTRAALTVVRDLPRRSQVTKSRSSNTARI